MSHYSVLALPASERPRERLRSHGPESIASSELIAIILGSGTKSVPVLQLSHNILSQFGSLDKLADASIEELLQIHGLGPAKALQLKAALSLGQRLSSREHPPKYKIDNPLKAFHYLKDKLARETRELFIVLLLDAKGCVIDSHIVSLGGVSQVMIQQQEVFFPAIRQRAASVILAHNHPSGDPTPSPEDLEVTAEIVRGGKILGITIQDHLVIGKECYVSIRQQDNKLFS